MRASERASEREREMRERQRDAKERCERAMRESACVRKREREVE
jgi:hypothetical protein